MRPCENVIVTVIFGDRRLDMELPTFLSMNELLPEISETLNVLFPGNGYSIVLSYDGAALEGNDTLASRGIWDGSILTAHIGKAGDWK